MIKKIYKSRLLNFTEEASMLLPSAHKAVAALTKKSRGGNTKPLTDLYIFFHTVGKSSSYLGLSTVSELGDATGDLLSSLLDKKIPKFLSKHNKVLTQAVTFMEEALTEVEKRFSDEKLQEEAKELIEKILLFSVDSKKEGRVKVPQQEGEPDKSAQENGSGNFIEEARTTLSEIEANLKLFKEGRGDRSIALTLSQKTRLLRGCAGVYGYKHLERLNQRIEALLELVEAGRRFNMDDLMDTLLIMKDVNQDTLTAISGGESGDIFDLDSYLEAIDEIRPLAPEEPPEASGEQAPPPTNENKELTEETPKETDATDREAAQPPGEAGKPDDETESRVELAAELVEAFVQEADDMLPDVEQHLLDWNKSPQDLELVANIFRRVHSLKGNCGFYGFRDLERLSHRIESILSMAKSGAALDTASLVDTLLRMKDVIAHSVNDISLGGTGSISGLEALLTELDVYIPENKEAKTSSLPESGPAASEKDRSMDLNLTPELINMFISETEELLQDMEQNLLSWEEDPKNTEIISSLFRRVHSLKGNSGFYGFADLEKLSHSMESILDAAKSGVSFNLKNLIQNLLRMKDVIGEALADITKGGSGQIQDLNIYIELLEKILPKGWQDSEEDNQKPGRLGHILVDKGVISGTDVKKVIREQNKPFGEKLVEMGLATSTQVDSALDQQKSEEKKAKGFGITHSKGKEITKRQNIRVDLDKLDTLITLIGEMAIAENMITNNPEIIPLRLESFKKAAQHMNKIVRELQEMAMTIRMVPVSGLFRRMIRLVHDLSSKCQKKVDFKLVGEDTEVDKTVVEIITDPLVHIIRNSLDHGLEPPDERIRQDKPASGSLILSASHEEGQVRITIADDGRGLDKEKILLKARENGLIEDDGSTMTDQQIFALIFNPGFSTADRITDVSGRGVGMDVVKKNLDKVKGRVSVKSKRGKGTRISLRIPLTLAIIDGMVIKIDDLKYVIPVLSIKESFVPAQDAITETPDGSAVVRVRNRFYPVIRFGDLFEESKIAGDRPLTDGVLVLLENQDNNVCLYVDELIGQQQIVIKALSSYIDNVKGVSGCTILGDGEICLILDVGSLVDSVEQKEIEHR